ncbi:unnamed protein product [Camellia sinensis]
MVVGESRTKEEYFCFAEHYCACYSFFYDIVNRREQLCCKHQLAARLAASLGACVDVKVITIISLRGTTMAQSTTNITTVQVEVGVVLDMNTWVGKMGLKGISMALSDFYSSHVHYKTRLELHVRDSKDNVVGAAATV